MAIYEYVCSECEHRYEKIQKSIDPEDKTCPKCGKPVTRPLSVASLSFKGKGWYITDYAKTSPSE